MFNLSRYFSTLSFLLIALAAVLLGAFHRELALREMREQAESHNVALVRVLENALAAPLAGLVAGTLGLEKLPAGDDASRDALRSQIAALTQGGPVLGVAIHNRLGTTVLATDPAELGGRHLDEADFREAMQGRVGSRLLRVEPAPGAPAVDLLNSRIPLRQRDGSVVGVYEIERDVSAFVARLNRDLWLLGGVLAAVFGGLYLAQYLLVRHAQRILREQARGLADARDTLELRVEARTEELVRINRRLSQEIDERRQVEQQLNYLAHHDALTGLANRRAFIEHVERCIGEAKPLAILFIDLDQFKQVNDTLGHGVGDDVLIAVAARLEERAHWADRLARLGGDEFICLIEGADQGDEIALAAGEIVAAFAEPFELGGNAFYLSASVGVCRHPRDGVTVGELLRNADTAMYRAKADGRGQFRFYETTMTDDARQRSHLENRLRQAVDRNELEIYLQPQVDTASGRLVGAEALLRWRNPALGLVMPGRFIPLAEETGLIFALGNWVLREACRQVVEWREIGFALPQISVNLSARQLERPGFVDEVLGILAETGIDPRVLKLELTESALMAIDNVTHLLQPLRDLGVTLALDDFGTGYSSLAYLKALPVQQLKIDASFVQGIGRGTGDEAIIRTIMELARSLSFEVVAEGVETAGQARFLEALGCQRLQGHLHGAAVAPEAFLARWREHR